MFRQRLLTTIILIPLVLGIIYYANIWFFSGLILLLVMACGVESLQLIPINRLSLKVVYLCLLLLAFLVIHYVYREWLLVALGCWFLIIWAVLFFPRSQSIWGNGYTVSIFFLLLLPVFGQSLIAIYEMESGKSFIVYVMCLVWAADIGAYVTGKQWGRHKLIPAVSPGKSLEGLAGGAFLSMLVAIAGYYYFQPGRPLPWGLTVLFVFLIALLGDLFISILKRRCHLKDTSHLIPGHGGILDRLDSMIAAAPVFYFALVIMNSGITAWF
ncbi:phosphatidate cytidylyltransferase [Legionella spiritensis]|uniref:phosphatidate cytidylyltransferase n=1 Tax=Legionella spiritensis TaxID=452 RepID=UPI000F6F5C6B|nr:phosphatidate cytidylyltransferase [Legionella spiritensis]VEG92216.1 phosphatidate cytidylyltransferase [Legionella spiritensis]